MTTSEDNFSIICFIARMISFDRFDAGMFQVSAPGGPRNAVAMAQVVANRIGVIQNGGWTIKAEAKHLLTQRTVHLRRDLHSALQVPESWLPFCGAYYTSANRDRTVYTGQGPGFTGRAILRHIAAEPNCVTCCSYLI